MKSLVVITLSLFLAACGEEDRSAERQSAASRQDPAPPAATSTPPSEPTIASQAAAQEQTIDVAGEFTPASVAIPANTPARLHFRRGDKPTCADEIVIPELNMRKKLAKNQTVTFDLPPQQARTLTFLCGMNMLKGTVVVQ